MNKTAEEILHKHIPLALHPYLDNALVAMEEYAAQFTISADWVMRESLMVYLKENKEMCDDFGKKGDMFGSTANYYRGQANAYQHVLDHINHLGALPISNPESKHFIVNANDPKYLIGVLKNIEREMPKAKRKRTLNISMVRDYLTGHTSKGGRTSAYETCVYLGIDPDGYSITPLLTPSSNE